MLNSYPKVFNLGHPAVDGLIDHEVIVEEKIDGSQISFGLMFNDATGTCQLQMRSSGQQIDLDAPDGMFAKAVERVRTLESSLIKGWTYRGEYLQKPKHNVLAYNRVPKDHIILYDVNTGYERYANHDMVAHEARNIGLEVTPILYRGKLPKRELQGFLDELLEGESILGGKKEGVVIKCANRSLFGRDGKPLVAKYVCPLFKEKHAKEWKYEHQAPKHGDVVFRLSLALKTEARWHKAVQHLRERGELQNEPKDIPAIISEVTADTLAEEHDYIVSELLKQAWPEISRNIIRGLPEWYKGQLLSRVEELDTAS